uniref:Uncharacterized protein n=1 Tax=Rhizophora mucronata TaxID=61149 RepID=A0A2P2N1H9_RHIMU
MRESELQAKITNSFTNPYLEAVVPQKLAATSRVTSKC